jgi:hypothetical protein
MFPAILTFTRRAAAGGALCSGWFLVIGRSASTMQVNNRTASAAGKRAAERKAAKFVEV